MRGVKCSWVEMLRRRQQIEAAECGEDVAELRCVDESAVSKWKRSIDVVNCVQAEIDLSQLEHFQPTHAVEIARHFRKLRGKAEKWDEENLCRDHPKALDAIDRACQREPGRPVETVDNVNEINRPNGNTREAGLRRLRKDRPDLHEQVLAQGRSTREIAKAVGVSKNTVAREVSTVPSGTVDNQPTEASADIDKPFTKSQSAPKRLSKEQK